MNMSWESEVILNYCLTADFKGDLGETDGRGGEQPEGVAAAGSWPRPPDHVHDRHVTLSLSVCVCVF